MQQHKHKQIHRVKFVVKMTNLSDAQTLVKKVDASELTSMSEDAIERLVKLALINTANNKSPVELLQTYYKRYATLVYYHMAIVDLRLPCNEIPNNATTPTWHLLSTKNFASDNYTILLFSKTHK